MNVGGRRQLPSWMMKSSAAEQASISETKEENKENDSEELNANAYEPQKKVKRAKHDTGVRALDKKSPLLKKCETRTRKGKSIKQDGGETCGREPQFLKQCRTSGSRTESKKQENQGVENNHLEDDDSLARERFQGRAQGMKKKAKICVEDSHDGAVPGEDEFTVEDLVRIAEEYLSADTDKELQKSEELELESEARHSIKTTSEVGSGKDPTARHDKPLPTSSLDGPLLGEGSISRPPNTCDSGQDILSLFFGPLLKNLG